jgi:GMP synthase (glutamine-hydrolysing)
MDQRSTLLALQHIACEPPGAYEDELRERGGSLVRVMVDRGEPLPDWREFDGIVAMGGPMGAYEDDRLPWLAPEKRMIADAVAAGMPVWGVCLGAQLLAASLGATVSPGPAPEVGLLAVQRTDAAASDPVFSLLPDEFPALQWHGDTFTLPAGAVQLARSDAYEQQAFTVNRAYAVQFHLEVGAALATEWGEVPAYAESLEAIMGARALPRLIDEVAAHEGEMRALARALFGAWLDRVVAPCRGDGPRWRAASVGTGSPSGQGSSSATGRSGGAPAPSR